MEFNKDNILKLVFLYYIAEWFLDIGLPTIVPAEHTPYILVFILGYFTYKHLNRELEDYIIDLEDRIERLSSKLNSPKIVTDWGIYNWDGIRYTQDFNGDNYSIFAEGYSYLGEVQEGNKVFICPTSHVEDLGKHRLLRSNFSLKKKKYVPEDFNEHIAGKWVIKGDTLSPFFAELRKDDIDLRRQLDKQIEYTNTLSDNFSEITKLASDNAMIRSVIANSTDLSGDER